MILLDTDFVLCYIPIVFDNLPIEARPILNPIHPFQVKVDDANCVGGINGRLPEYIGSTNSEYHGTILERCRKQVCHEVSIAIFRIELGVVQCAINRVVGSDKFLQLFKRGVPPNGS